MRKNESSLSLQYFGSRIGKFGADVVDEKGKKSISVCGSFDFLKMWFLVGPGGSFCDSGPVLTQDLLEGVNSGPSVIFLEKLYKKGRGVDH
jgi:hypothetical protein